MRFKIAAFPAVVYLSPRKKQPYPAMPTKNVARRISFHAWRLRRSDHSRFRVSRQAKNNPAKSVLKPAEKRGARYVKLRMVMTGNTLLSNVERRIFSSPCRIGERDMVEGMYEGYRVRTLFSRSDFCRLR